MTSCNFDTITCLKWAIVTICCTYNYSNNCKEPKICLSTYWFVKGWWKIKRLNLKLPDDEWASVSFWFANVLHPRPSRGPRNHLRKQGVPRVACSVQQLSQLTQAFPLGGGWKGYDIVYYIVYVYIYSCCISEKIIWVHPHQFIACTTTSSLLAPPPVSTSSKLVTVVMMERLLAIYKMSFQDGIIFLKLKSVISDDYFTLTSDERHLAPNILGLNTKLR